MTSRPTILLLDSEPLLRRATAIMLQNRGARVSVAASAEEAIALASERVFDVAILDVPAHGTSPAEILRRIRARGLAPRQVVAITSAPLDPREAAELTLVLRKPYPFDLLLAAVFGPAGRRRPTMSGVFPVARAGQKARPVRTKRAANGGFDEVLYGIDLVPVTLPAAPRNESRLDEGPEEPRSVVTRIGRLERQRAAGDDEAPRARVTRLSGVRGDLRAAVGGEGRPGIRMRSRGPRRAARARRGRV
jgi:CheY-like chemotaxis protein